jgi:hypothetical protein
LSSVPLRLGRVGNGGRAEGRPVRAQPALLSGTGMPTTCADLHRIAAHVLGRRRFEVSGHFGLRASPRGVATPAFGPEPEVVRLSGPRLVREVGAEAQTMALDGSTLAELAAFAGADPTAAFTAGSETPEPGPLHQPFAFDEGEFDVLYGWFDLAWRVLDVVTARPVAGSGWSTIQLWPEHFDVGTVVDLGSGRGVNLGFSPGDRFSEEPYVYVGPWGPERPGGPDYWNAPFGAVALRTSVTGAEDCVAFLGRGLELLTTS